MMKTDYEVANVSSDLIFEWVKTGVITKRQFNLWVNVQLGAAYSEGLRDGEDLAAI